MLIKRVAPFVVLVSTAVYPPAYNDTYIKTTTKTLDMDGFKSLDPSQPLTGDAYPYCWMSNNGQASNQRLHVDLGTSLIIHKIDYVNYHNAGYNTNRGGQGFSVQGSNSATSFAELTYSTDTGWTTISKSPTSLVRHTEGSNTAIWNSITLTNETAYRYWAIKLASNYGDASYMGLRRLLFYALL